MEHIKKVVLVTLLSPVFLIAHLSFVPEHMVTTKWKDLNKPVITSITHELNSLLPKVDCILTIGACNNTELKQNYSLTYCENIKTATDYLYTCDALFITDAVEDPITLLDTTLFDTAKPIILGNINKPKLYDLLVQLTAKLDCPFTMYTIGVDEHFAVLFPVDHTKECVISDPLILTLMYSPSHAPLAQEWLLPSLKELFKIATCEVPQECPSGRIFKPGWGKTTARKIKHIAETIANNSGRILLYCDADIQFFTPVSEVLVRCLGDNDCAFQLSYKTRMCSGLFVARCTQKTADFFYDVYAFMKKYDLKSDQAAMNYLLNHTEWRNHIKHCFLPTTFINGGLLKQRYLSKPPYWKTPLTFLPDNLHIHHATLTRTVKDKLVQLKEVRRRLSKG